MPGMIQMSWHLWWQQPHEAANKGNASSIPLMLATVSIFPSMLWCWLWQQFFDADTGNSNMMLAVKSTPAVTLWCVGCHWCQVVNNDVDTGIMPWCQHQQWYQLQKCSNVNASNAMMPVIMAILAMILWCQHWFIDTNPMMLTRKLMLMMARVPWCLWHWC